MRFHREWFLLIGSLLVVAALYNHYLGHSAYLVELIFVAIGCGLALVSITGLKKSVETSSGLFSDFLCRFLPRDKVGIIIPLFGFALIVVWSGYKILVGGRTDLQMDDFMVTLFGLSLVLYQFGPSRFALQKDFVVLYLLFMTIVFAVIWEVYSFVTGRSYVSVTAKSEYYLITVPVVAILRFLGVVVDSELHAEGPGMTNYIIYHYHDVNLRLGIGTSCSGLYAAGLFFSAFLAFVLVRYRIVDAPVLAGLGIGFAVTWVSNIIRMVVTISVGAAYGHPALVFVHGYLGIIIFVAFIALFWYLIVRWLDKIEDKRMAKKTENPPMADTV